MYPLLLVRDMLDTDERDLYEEKVLSKSPYNAAGSVM